MLDKTLLFYGFLAYILGSIPFALLISKIFTNKDLRNLGSGNIGATNAVRVLGKKLGSIVLILDVVKGFAVILFCKHYNIFPAENYFLIGICAVLGHIFPIWLGFRGGKGVATSLGMLIGLNFAIAIFFILVWILTFSISRYSSVSSILAQIATSFVLILLYHNTIISIYTCLLTALIVFKHKKNIVELLKKTSNNS